MSSESNVAQPSAYCFVFSRPISLDTHISLNHEILQPLLDHESTKGQMSNTLSIWYSVHIIKSWIDKAWAVKLYRAVVRNLWLNTIGSGLHPTACTELPITPILLSCHEKAEVIVVVVTYVGSGAAILHFLEFYNFISNLQPILGTAMYFLKHRLKLFEVNTNFPVLSVHDYHIICCLYSSQVPSWTCWDFTFLQTMDTFKFIPVRCIIWTFL